MTNKSQTVGGSYSDSPRDQDYNSHPTGEQFVWETHQVQLSRVPGYGFGIAISGGIDNPHFPNGDPAIAVCDVLNAGPAAGKVEINDRIIRVDSQSLENVHHAKAISVLNNSPDTIELLIKRKVYLDVDAAEPVPMKIVLKKKSKRDEYGLVLGYRLYVKKIVGNSLAAQEGGLKEGDDILKLNNFTTDNLSLTECRRMIERSRDKLSLIVLKDPQNERRSVTDYRQLPPKIDNIDQPLSQLYDSQLSGDVFLPDQEYDQGTVRPTDEGPLRPPLPNFDSSNEVPPPSYADFMVGEERAPNFGPRLQPLGGSGLEVHSSQSHLDEKDIGISRRTNVTQEPRKISFRKSKGGVGVRLAGGNNVGIFVAAVQPDTAAYEQGLQEGDVILHINNTDMQSKTREDAVLLLLSLESQVELLVQYRREEYERFINSNEFGDSFYVRAHFNNPEPESGQIGFTSGDVFHVRDTLHGGVVGAWKAVLVDRNLQEKQEGVIPNRSGAEQISLNQQQKSAAQVDRENSLLRKNFFKRRSARRTKSMSKEHWEDMMSTLSSSKFPAYENVVRKTPNFFRPVVLYGSVADIARRELLNEDALFRSPARQTDGKKEGGVIKLAAIRDVIDSGRHCVLDVNPNAVDRLNYAGYYPLVIYLRADSKQTVKEIRTQFSKDTQSSAKLYEESIKIERSFAYLFSATITLTSNGSWINRLRQLIQESHDQPIWVSEKKVDNQSDDYYVLSSQRLSYVSSPVSESGEVYSDQDYQRSMLRWSSDPSMGDPRRVQATPPIYNPDFRSELKSVLDSHQTPPKRELQRYHSNPNGYHNPNTSVTSATPQPMNYHSNPCYQDSDEFNRSYPAEPSPYARPVPRHRRYLLRPEEEYQDGEPRSVPDGWRPPPVPEKSLSLHALPADYEEKAYPHTYSDQRAYDSESSGRDPYISMNRDRYPDYRYDNSLQYATTSLPNRRGYNDPNHEYDNGWESDALKYTRSTSNPYSKPATIDRIKMQDIRSRGAERPRVPPKPVRSKSDSARFDVEPGY